MYLQENWFNVSLSSKKSVKTFIKEVAIFNKCTQLDLNN